MSLKEELVKLRDKVKNVDSISGRKYIPLDSLTKKIYPQEKVEEFLKSFDKKKDFDHTTSEDLRNLIEKIAIWYELRYPEYEINRILHCIDQDPKKIDDIMFKDNNYLKELGTDSNNPYEGLEWSKLFNAHAFISSLPSEEKWLIDRPRYNNIVYLDKFAAVPYVFLTRNGIVTESHGISNYTDGEIIDGDVIGLHLSKVLELFKERKVKLPENNGIEKELGIIDELIDIKENILDCAMYRMIARDPGRIGPRRAFLFAKEFKRNIDIPMMYGIDRSDPGLKDFINEYIKAGGHKDLKCYNGGLYSIYNNKVIELISIGELIEIYNNFDRPRYTEEEHNLHQRLVDSIASLIPKEPEAERVKRLRIERKLNKNRQVDTEN